ncbi:MAG: hypothetical protein ACREP1_01405 [Rhodanobacteraceae bacterium]
MGVKEIRNLYSAMPFRPFDIVLTNGTAVRVAHPEFMSFSPDHETVHVYDLHGGHKYIDVKLVIALERAKNGAHPRKRKR